MTGRLGALILLFISFSTCAGTRSDSWEITKLNKLEFWEFKLPSDGMMFYLGPDADHSIVFYVKPFMANGNVSDSVVIFCEAQNHILNPGQRLRCRGNMMDFISLDIAEFKNGSAGSYTFVDNPVHHDA